jgi:hypothetical protein
MGRGVSILDEKVIDEEGNIAQLVIWKVPAAAEYPAGIR